MQNTTSLERLTQFITLYEKYYAVKLSLEEGEQILLALLGLLRAVKQGDVSAPEKKTLGRHNNAAPVIDNKNAKIHDQ